MKTFPKIIIVVLVALLFLALLANKFFYKSDMTPTPSDDASTIMTDTSATLDLSGQQLSKLPASVLSKTSLLNLNISNNNITGALPAEIKNLKKLKSLDASNNQMTGLPAEVGQLADLETLNLANNNLTGLPYELGNLKKLKKLDLSGNNYSVQDLDIIKRNLPTTAEIIY